MRVVQTVRQRRSFVGQVLAASLLVGLSPVGLAFGWWLARPGVEVGEVAGVALPPATRLVREDHGPDGFVATYLAAAVPTSDAVEWIEAMPGLESLGQRRYRLPDGTQVFVAPPAEVPATRLMPIEAVSDGVPLGTRSWIVVTRGVPPASTGAVAVPPFGAS